MKRQVEIFEISFNYHTLLFASQTDAEAAATALTRGAYVSAAANPLNPAAKIELLPVEPKIRRVFVPVPERVCIATFGKRLKSATPELVEARRIGE